MTRGRAIRILTVLILVGAILRFTGLVEIPGHLLVAGIALDVALGLVEGTVLVLLGRRVYREHRARHEPFEAFIETLREVEPKPVFVVMEKELRAYHAVYRRLRGRRQPGVE